MDSDFSKQAAGVQTCLQITFPMITAEKHRAEGKKSPKPITGGVCSTQLQVF
jgi:hypothetical protein